MGLTKKRWEERFPSREKDLEVERIHKGLAEGQHGWMLGCGGRGGARFFQGLIDHVKDLPPTDLIKTVMMKSLYMLYGEWIGKLQVDAV